MAGLTHARVLVAGAGLAGLTAARALERAGAEVRVVEARARVGGRLWTIREGFDSGQHAEAGADLIESSQTTLLRLIKDVGLRPVRILGEGFGYYGTSENGRPRARRQGSPMQQIEKLLGDLVGQYRLFEGRWDGALPAALGRQSVAGWLAAHGADPTVLARVRALRGLFLADPEDLSMLALVDFLADDASGTGGQQELFRLREGNDRLAQALAGALRTPVELSTVLRRLNQRHGRVVATLETRSGLADYDADMVVAALPATTLRDVLFEPALPVAQQQAIARLRYGRATRVLLQFARRFWRPSIAFGSDLETGAVWDGNEHQRGRPGILSLLAGGEASPAIQLVLRDQGPPGLIDRLRWLGEPSPLVSSRVITWEQDPWVCGGYAYFDPSFDPAWRDALACPFGRIVFAGEHTSVRWQGYMNGAVESGLRAAAEIQVLGGC